MFNYSRAEFRRCHLPRRRHKIVGFLSNSSRPYRRPARLYCRRKTPRSSLQYPVRVYRLPPPARDIWRPPAQQTGIATAKPAATMCSDHDGLAKLLPLWRGAQKCGGRGWRGSGHCAPHSSWRRLPPAAAAVNGAAPKHETQARRQQEPSQCPFP